MDTSAADLYFCSANLHPFHIQPHPIWSLWDLDDPREFLTFCLPFLFHLDRYPFPAHLVLYHTSDNRYRTQFAFYLQSSLFHQSTTVLFLSIIYCGQLLLTNLMLYSCYEIISRGVFLLVHCIIYLPHVVDRLLCGYWTLLYTYF